MTESSEGKKKGSLSDTLINLATRTSTGLGGQFSDRPNPNPDIKSSGQIKEKELLVVKEAIEITEKARKEGGIASSERNPFGKTEALVMYVMGDVHFSSSQPKDSYENRSKILKALQSIGPQPIIQKFKGKDWHNEVKPTQRVLGYYSAMNSILRDIPRRLNSEDNSNGNMSISIVDVGDRSNTDSHMGDIALNTIEIENFRRKAEIIAQEAKSHEPLKPTVNMTFIKGTHDEDVWSRGLEGAGFERKLYGAQIFTQEVGDNSIVLALNTNFVSHFWLDNYEHLKGRVGDNKELQQVVNQVENEIDLQKTLVSETLDSGKNIILIGHEEELMGQIIPLEDSKITHIISGHKHTAANELTGLTNVEGKPIQRVVVGASIGGVFGLERAKDPVSYSIVINEGGEVKVNSLTISEHDKDYPHIT